MGAESYRLAGTQQLAPLRQGDFAQLCGLYSILNALQLAFFPTKPLTRPELKVLFQLGIEHLRRRRLLTSAFEGGLAEAHWLALIRAMLQHAKEQQGQLFIGEPILAAHSRKDRQGAFASLEQSIQAGFPVLLGLWGEHSHYTVLSGISGTRLTFFDSGDIRWISRSSCSFMRDGKRRRHRISRHSVFALVPEVVETP